MNTFSIPRLAVGASAWLAASLFTSACCDDDKLCSVRELVDLLIPLTVSILNPQNGQPIPDVNGQPLQDANMLVYNRRTGEYFSPKSGSRFGVQLGDYLQFGVRVFNQYTASKCDKLKTAPMSQTGFQLAFSNGSTPAPTVFRLPDSFTPEIPAQQANFAVAEVQITRPGYYYLKADADNPNKVDEYVETNNFFSNPTNGTTLGRGAAQVKSRDLLLEIKAPANGSYIVNEAVPAVVLTAVGTTEQSWRQSEIVRFANSTAYVRYYQDAVLRQAHGASNTNARNQQ